MVYKPTYNWGAPSCMVLVFMVLITIVTGAFTHENGVLMGYMMVIQWHFTGFNGIYDDIPSGKHRKNSGKW